MHRIVFNTDLMVIKVQIIYLTTAFHRLLQRALRTKSAAPFLKTAATSVTYYVIFKIVYLKIILNMTC